MSKIEDLINKLCPNGVEFKPLNEIFKQFSGMTGVSNKWKENGNCKFIDYMNAYKNLKIDVNRLESATVKKLEQNKLAKGDILLTSASETPDECAISSVIEEDIADDVFMDDHLFGIRLKDEYKKYINTSYINYYMHTNSFRKDVFKAVRGVTRFYISIDTFMNILEVQHEIVHILDDFTLLSAELSAELKARQKQYEYYLHHLLDIKEGKEMTIGDIYDFKYGTGNTIPEGGGEYPVYGSNGMVGYYSEYNSEDAPVIGHIGAYAGIVNWAKGKHFVTYNGVICKHKNMNVDKRYAYYILLTQDFIGEQKGAQPFVSYDALKKPIVKIPELKEQQRIVNILDRFDKLCNDISEGLPAEIEARQKQYEYYRDKLLTFKELEVNEEQ